MRRSAGAGAGGSRLWSFLDRHRTVAIVAAWTVIGVLEATKSIVSRELRGADPLSLQEAVIAHLPWWYGWAALTPVILLLARLAPLDRGRRALHGTMHLAASLALSALHLAAVGTLYYYTMARGQPGAPGDAAELVRFWIDAFLLGNMLTYWVVVGAHYAFTYQKRAAAQELETLRLRETAVRARLGALRMELNPHFLYNALNSVSGLVREGSRGEAVAALATLGELLRSTLNMGDGDVPLDRELDLVTRYLDLARLRFGDRLSVVYEIDDEARRGAVPPLLLQPLVENAILHGVEGSTGEGRVVVRAEVAGPRLVLDVWDDGAGVDGDDGASGRGLRNVRERLSARYGERADLDLRSTGSGTRARVTLPWRPVPREAEATSERSWPPATV